MGFDGFSGSYSGSMGGFRLRILLGFREFLSGIYKGSKLRVEGFYFGFRSLGVPGVGFRSLGLLRFNGCG